MIHVSRCPDGWALFMAWVEVCQRTLALYSISAGLTGENLLAAQEDNQDYKAALAAYRAHLHDCPHCKQAITI